MKPLIPSLLLLLLSALATPAAPVPLFDGKSLEGWEGETAKTWRVQDGAIVGGSLEGNPHNEFLATKKSYHNFILKLEYKLVGTEGFINGGVQIRSRRLAEPAYEMIGYQADIGAGYSGCLYDESRRKKVLAAPDKELIAKLEKPEDWNAYEIRCEGPRIRLYLNGTMTVDYTEREPGMDEPGLIGLQIHGKNKAEAAYRKITIEELPDALVPEQSDILRRFGEPESGAAALVPFVEGKFGLGDNEVVVFAGQTNLVREAKSAELEARLARAFALKKPRFRSMAWEGDTVFEQWRDLNFGLWRDQLATVGATVVIAQFGQIEAFDGVGRLPEFTAAYAHLLDEFSMRTPRVVLLSPMPFEKPLAPHAPDLTLRNADVGAYANAVRELARQRGAVFVDLFAPLSGRKGEAPRLTDNGMHLNDTGLRVVADLISLALGAEVPPADSDRSRAFQAPTGAEAPPVAPADKDRSRAFQAPTAAEPPPLDNASELRAAIVEKNRLFSNTWRPANWSFVYGDRVTQLFGKAGGTEPSLRETFEHYKPLIAELDARVHALARGEKAARVFHPPLENATATILPGPAEQLSPEAELATFTVAGGYEVNLFASERDGVVKPTQIAWDEKGRLFVACSPTYPHILPSAKPGDSIIVLEDTKGVGRADKATKFAEGLTMVQGLEPGDGGLYVCDFDQLVHLRDSNGSGRADQSRVIFSGFGIGDTHQLINSITHGPDGSLWFTQGLHAFSRVETPWGLARLEKAGVWRMNPKTLRLDAFFNGAKAGHNCWGVAFDDFGQVFHKSGDRPEGYWTVPGMVRLENPDEYHPVGPLFATTPKTTSLEIIGTRGLPDGIQGCAVIAGYFGSVIELHRFLDDGAGFKTEQLPKLLKSSSTAFRPVDVSVGPDGAIYVADWYNPVIGHYQASYADPRRDRTHGRIWRISAKNRELVKQPNLSTMPPAELLEQLRSPERWTRAQAKRLLSDAPEAEVVKAADAWVAKLDPAAPNYERLLLEGIGVFEAHETPRPELLAKLLAARDARVRAYGARVIGAWADRLPDPLALLRERIRDEHPRVRLEAIVACSYVAKPEAVEVAVPALDAPRDKFIDYALAQSVRALQPHWQSEMAAGRLNFGGNASHADYVRKLAAAAVAPPRPGRLVYEMLCLNCHQPGGKGLPGVYPPVAGSEWVSGDKGPLIKMLLHGLNGPITVAGQQYGAQTPIPMPPSGLTDQQIADVLTFVRSSFGNESPAISQKDVESLRSQANDRATFWTAEELKKASNQ